jgi:hypothetical protein
VTAGPWIGELPSEGTEQKGQANTKGPPADKEPNEKRTHHIASPCPESGHVHVWQAESSRWFVGHTVSQEVAEVRLESGDIPSRVTLEFDDEGFGCLMATGDDGAAPAFIKPLIDHFQVPVFQKENEGHPHEVFIAHGSDEAPQLASLTELSTQHDMVSITCPGVGPLRTTVEAKAAYFYRPRSDGNRIMWGLTSVVNALGLDTDATNSRKVKWIHNMLPSWETHMQNLNLAGSILRSQQYHLPKDAPDPSRCLPWPAVTSVGLLAVLMRMQQPSKTHGGIQNEDGQQAVAAFLKQLFKILCNRAFQVTITFDLACCMHDHPVPPSGTGQVILQIGEDGNLTWPTRYPYS